MIIRREALKAALAATTTDDTRYFLNAVQVRPDGTVAATDGHVAFIAKEAHPPAQANGGAYPDDDFPIVPGAETHGSITVPVLVDSDIAKRLIAGTAKKATIPVLACVQFSQNNDGAVAVSTDLQVPCVVHIKDAGQTFPAIERVMPAEDKPSIKVCLSNAVLESLLKASKAIQGRKMIQTITFSVPTDQTTCVSAIRVGMTSDEVHVDGVIMPCRE